MKSIILSEIDENQIKESASIIKETLDKFWDWLITKSAYVLLAIIFLVIGLKLVGLIVKIVKRSFAKANMEESVSGFLLSFIKIALSCLVFITTATIVGFEVTSFVTILGTAGVALSLGLQGSLSNLVGGILILILKPFTIGDYIKEDNKGNEGTVISIDIFYTRLKTPENKIVVIPNGILSNTSLLNTTVEDKKRVDINITIAYNSDIEMVKDVINNMLNSNDKVLKEEPMAIFINEFKDSGIEIGIRVWALSSDYFNTLWELRENILLEFNKNNIDIPYNHLDVNIKNK